MGTSSRIIKIISLKGYEFEIYEAHQAGIRLLTFIPNEGVMISVDDYNEVAVWNLKDLSADPIRVEVPQPGTSGGLIVTQLYAPTFLSSEADNHKNVFFALSSGDVLVFDWTNATFSSLVIAYSLMFHRQKKDNVSDIKAHPLKMHRLLIAYEETAVIVYSLNKNRDIQQVHFAEFDQDKGFALAVEFANPEGSSFVVGFSSGLLCYYKSESSSQKPYKTINMNSKNLYHMQMYLVS